MKPFLYLLLTLLAGTAFAQNPNPDNVDCPPVWQQNIFDICIGVSGISIADYNQNGREEMVLGNENTWTIVEYSPAHQDYLVIWGSREYEYLHTVLVADADNDGEDEIVVLHNHRNIELYDLTTLQLKSTWNLSFLSFWTFGLTIGDVDNDGLNEMIFNHDLGIDIARIQDGECGHLYDIQASTSNIRIGDIDGDGINEIVLSSGPVYRIEDGTPQNIWDYMLGYNNANRLQLADIDNDGLPEIINSFMGYKVFDGDTRMLKWEITTDRGIDAFTVAETGNGGLPEILYVENQWGDVVCLETTEGAEMWQVGNPDHGGSNIGVGDFDGDGNLEFMYGANCSSSGPDHLFVYQMPDLTHEFTSVYDFGRYQAIRVADTDNDSQNELITLSLSSEFSGAGIITIYDAETKELEWKSNDTLLGDWWEYARDLEMEDVDHDGDVEMVVVGYANWAAIAVINARTHEVDTVKTFNNYAFEDLTIADLNNDGTFEYIVTSYNKLSIINSQTFQITHTFGGNSGYSLTSPVTGNIDDDPNTELVYIHGDIYVMDGLTEEVWVVSNGSTPFRSCALYDCNNDGIMEILANTGNGIIYMVDGRTRELTLYLSSLLAMESFFPVNLTGDHQPEIIFSYGKNITALSLNGRQMNIEINDDASYYDFTTSVTDYDNNGHYEIFTGTNYYVQQRNASVFECIGLTAEVEIEPSVCNGSTGSAEVFPAGGIEPYTYIWSTGQTTSSIENQPMGPYDVTVTDATGCSLTLDASIYQTWVMIDSIAETPDNPMTGQCEGSITIFPAGGTPPYSVLINSQPEPINGTTLQNLCSGVYIIVARDANGCISLNHQVWIDAVIGLPEATPAHPTLTFTLNPNPATDNTILELTNTQLSNTTTPGTTPNTYATISTIHGTPVTRIPLTTQRTTIDVSKFAGGMYLIAVSNDYEIRTAKFVVK